MCRLSKKRHSYGWPALFVPEHAASQLARAQTIIQAAEPVCGQWIQAVGWKQISAARASAVVLSRVGRDAAAGAVSSDDLCAPTSRVVGDGCQHGHRDGHGDGQGRWNGLAELIDHQNLLSRQETRCLKRHCATLEMCRSIPSGGAQRGLGARIGHRLREFREHGFPRLVNAVA